MTWKIERELIGTEPVDSKLPAGDMTELSKITATHIETGYGPVPGIILYKMGNIK